MSSKVCADGVDSVMAGEGRVGFRLGELLQAGVLQDVGEGGRHCPSRGFPFVVVV
jgi:hypothetical protein